MKERMAASSSAVLVAALVLAMTACVDPRLERFTQTTATGIDLQDVGQDVVLMAEEGNLAAEVASTEADRSDAFKRLLIDERGLFGPVSVDPKELAFEPVMTEQVFGFEGQRLASTMLVQIIDGARVLEAVQYGAWVVDPESGTSELRRVRAHLYDPPELPAPPPALKRVKVDEAAGRFVTWLRQERGIYDGDVDFHGTRVISERLSVAGYLARWTRVEPEGGVSRLVAILDARDLGVNVFSWVPACQAGQGVVP